VNAARVSTTEVDREVIDLHSDSSLKLTDSGMQCS